MAVLNVNPTRMQLQTLKAKLATSRRGHKLLKDKCDEMMRRFLETVREARELRDSVEKRLIAASGDMVVARSTVSAEVLDVAMMMPSAACELEVSKKNVMSVRIPQYTLKKSGDNDIFSYGYAFTSSALDGAVRSLSELMPDLVLLAEKEKACDQLSDEIEKTRRRVNALEHVMIPDYEDTIKFITMKLDENERSTAIRLMKVKDMMIERSRT